MTRKHRRLLIIACCGVGLGAASALALTAMRDNLVFFVGPTELVEHAPHAGRTVRLGGLVEAGSVHRGAENGEPVADFRVTDGKRAVEVEYRGILPDLFREGQGVVALGTLDAAGRFDAQEVLAKHDENYMPKEVVEALKKSGRWNPASGSAPPSVWNSAGTTAQRD